MIILIYHSKPKLKLFKVRGWLKLKKINYFMSVNNNNNNSVVHNVSVYYSAVTHSNHGYCAINILVYTQMSSIKNFLHVSFQIGHLDLNQIHITAKCHICYTVLINSRH
jgi:hypothetical protein